MLRILVVDDDEVDRESVRRVLENSGTGVSIREAADASSALKALREHGVDCVLLDFLLPDMNGLEFLEAIQDGAGKVPFPVVMLTGEGSEEVAVEAMKLGAYDYVVKSSRWSSQALIDTVKRAVERWRLIAEKERAEHGLKIKTAELEIAKVAAEKANAAKSEFLAAMSHDLRTPLNAILGFSEMMKEHAFGPLGDPHYEEYATDIFSSGTLLIRLINDVLDLSKIEAGKFDLADEPLDVAGLIDVCFRQLATTADARNQTLSVHVPPGLPKLLGDERALIQVLNNLVSNAVKFTPDGGSVTVTAALGVDGGMVIRVSDTGIGMSHADVAKALRPFEQSNSQQVRRHRGTGLGLHLCDNFMKLFDGELTVESEVDAGTAVTLIFPPARTQHVAQKAQTLS